MISPRLAFPRAPLLCRRNCGEDRQLARALQPRSPGHPACPSTWLARALACPSTWLARAHGLHEVPRSANKARSWKIDEKSSEAHMAGIVEKKLQELGITLTAPPAPVANYVPFVRS